MIRLTRLTRFALFPVLAAAAPLHAQNLLNNPGFESGLTGWRATGPACDYWGGSARVDPASGFGSSPRSGAADAAFPQYASSCYGQISQNILTTSGGVYNVSFFAAAFGGSPDSFRASFAGVVLMDQPLTTSYQLYSFDVTATGSSSVLDLEGWNAPGVEAVDDVSVTRVTPEPASFVLMATGLTGLAGLARRRRKRLDA